MNDQKLEKKVREDVVRVQRDLSILAEHSAARLGRLEDNVSQAAGKAKEDVTAWAEDGAAQLSKGFEKLTGDTQETVSDAAAAMKKDVGHKMHLYSVKAQKTADGFGKNIAKYPWVAVAIGLFAGFLLGILLRPTQQSVEEV